MTKKMVTLNKTEMTAALAIYREGAAGLDMRSRAEQQSVRTFLKGSLTEDDEHALNMRWREADGIESQMAVLVEAKNTANPPDEKTRQWLMESSERLLRWVRGKREHYATSYRSYRDALAQLQKLEDKVRRTLTLLRKSLGPRRGPVLRKSSVLDRIAADAADADKENATPNSPKAVREAPPSAQVRIVWLG